MAKVHFLLTPEWDWSGVKAMPAMASSPASFANRAAGPAPVGSAEDLRERGELQRSYYSFLNCLANADLGHVLLSAPGDTLTAALNDLMQGAATHVDPSVRKLCINTIGRLGADWLSPAADGTGPKPEQGGQGQDRQTSPSPSPALAVPTAGAGQAQGVLAGLSDFMAKQFGCEVLFEGLATPGSGIDIRDAAAISLLTEVAVQLKAVHRLTGQAFLGHLCGVSLPKLGWPPAAQEQLVAHITQSEVKQLKDFLKTAVLELRPNGAAGVRWR